MNNPYALTPQDLETLAKSTITPEVAAAPFVDIYRVDTVEGAAIVGQKPTSDRDFAGMVFRYYSLEGKERERRLRRDNPDIVFKDGRQKEEGKYLSPSGRSNLPYYPLIVHVDNFHEWMMGFAIPVIFVEGEKKALALMRIALENLVDGKPPFVVIGLAGVWNWKGTIGKTTAANGERVDEKGIIGDLYKIPFKKRKVLIFYDANVLTNESVKAARSQFAYALRDELGADVFFVDMPEGAQEQGINGPDDLAFLRGDRAVLDCIEQARPAFRLTQPKRETTEEKILRGAARRVLTPLIAETTGTPDSEEAIKRRLGAKTWKRLCSIYAQVGKFEPRERDFLFTLQALVGDEGSAEFYYLDLFKLLYPYNEGISQNSINQKIRDRFEQLEDAQEACGVRFVEWTPGKEFNGETYPSFVRLLSLEYIEQIENLAICDKDFARNNFTAFERASVKFAEMKLGKRFERKYKKPLTPAKQIGNGWQRVKGNIKTTVQRMEDNHFGEWAIAEDLAKATLDKETLSPELIESPEFVKAYAQHLPENFKALLLAELLAEQAAADTPNHVFKEVCAESDIEVPAPAVIEESPEVSGGEKTEKIHTSESALNVDVVEDNFTEIRKSAENPHSEARETASSLSTGEVFDLVDDELGGYT